MMTAHHSAREQALQYLDAYLDWAFAHKKLAHHSLLNYRRDLLRLFDLASAANCPEVITLQSFHIRQWVMLLHSEGHQPKSIARYLSSWRSWFAWLAVQGIVTRNPVLGVRAPKGAQSLPKALSVDDAVHLAGHCPVSADSLTAQPTNDSIMQGILLLRDHAMIELMYSSGLRVSELVGLDISPVAQLEGQGTGWLDVTQAQVQVLGKGSKPRFVPVGAPALSAIAQWMKVRERFVKVAPNNALFLGKNGTRLSVRSVQMRLAHYARLLGLPVHVHPHMLRHSFATHILQSSGDLRAVQELLGHAHVSATQIYTQLDFQHLASVYDATHPRAKKNSS